MKLNQFKTACEGNPALRPLWFQLLTAALDLRDYAIVLAIQVRSGKLVTEQNRNSFISLREKFGGAASRLVSKSCEVGLEVPVGSDLKADRVYALLRELPV